MSYEYEYYFQNPINHSMPRLAEHIVKAILNNDREQLNVIEKVIHDIKIPDVGSLRDAIACTYSALLNIIAQYKIQTGINSR